MPFLIDPLLQDQTDPCFDLKQRCPSANRHRGYQMGWNNPLIQSARSPTVNVSWVKEPNKKQSFSSELVNSCRFLPVAWTTCICGTLEGETPSEKHQFFLPVVQIWTEPGAENQQQQLPCSVTVLCRKMLLSLTQQKLLQQPCVWTADTVEPL